MIDLTLLGAVRAGNSADESPGIGQQPKRLALLAYLAAAHPRGAHRRDSIVAMFWPDLDQERARSALRQALHGIRKTLGAAVVSSGGTEVVALDPGHVNCDLWDLERASGNGDHAGVLDLYGGELLAGLHIEGAPDFEQWLDAERTRVRSLVRSSAWGAADSALVGRRSNDVVRHAEFALTLSSLDEAAARRAMRVVADAGERALALTIYERFANELRHELEIEPTPETRALADELRRPQMYASPSRIAPTPWMDTPSTILPRATRRSKWPVAAVLALSALAAAAQLAPELGADLDPRMIRVEPYRVENGSTALASVASDMMRESRAALAALDSVNVIAASGDSRAGTVVRGMIRPFGDSLDVRAEVIDIRNDAILATVRMRTTPASSAFTERLSVAVATALYPGWGTALSQPMSTENYRLFVDGMRSIKREAHDDALNAFTRAFRNDTLFTAAGLLAAMENYQTTRFAAADSLVRRIAARRADLRPVDGLLLEWLTRSLEGDRSGARNAMERVTKIAPSAELAWLQLAIDNVETGRPREALEAMDHIDKASAFGEAWPSYWATRIEALHLMRDHRREVDVAREAMAHHPDVTVLVTYELRALAALGRVDEVMRGVMRVADLPPGRGIDVPMTLRQIALELGAHGYTAEGKQVLARSRTWYAAQPSAERVSVKSRSGYARTLYLLGDFAAARAIYDSLRNEVPSCLDCAGIVGVIAAHTRDTDAVRVSLAQLNAPVGPFSFGRPLMWRARIAAALGDSASAVSLLSSAFAAGAELDVMTHTDHELSRFDPDAVYREFARIPRRPGN